MSKAFRYDPYNSLQPSEEWRLHFSRRDYYLAMSDSDDNEWNDTRETMQVIQIHRGLAGNSIAKTE